MNLAPRVCRSTNQTHTAEPEVCLRVVHRSVPDHGDLPAYRRQTVEITMGHDFENKIGSLTRRVPSERVVSGTPPTPRSKRTSPNKLRTPRVAELLNEARRWERLLDSGEVSSQAGIARREGLTRARVTQILGLLRLPSEIQEVILSLPKTDRRPTITERALRPIVLLEDSRKQLEAFGQLVEATGRP